MRKPAAEKGPPTWDSPEYIAECSARAKRVRITYVDVERWHTGILNGTWKRDDPEIRLGQRMSASSGPKDYFINDVISLFEANEQVDQVAAILLGRLLFLIVHVGKYWYDLSKPEARLVRVEMVKA